MAPFRCLTSSHNTSSMTTTPKTSFPTLVLNVAQASNVDNASSNNYSNHIAVIFGVAATVLAAASILVGVMQWRACRRRLCDKQAADDLEMGAPGIATDEDIDAVQVCAPTRGSTDGFSCFDQHGKEDAVSGTKLTLSGQTTCPSATSAQPDVAKGDG